MKNVLLIGDSIRMGYDKAVQKSLEGIANVYFPKENCRFAAYVLRNLSEYKDLCKDGVIDIVHWNAGLWDCLRLYEEEPQTPKEIYAYYIERVCVRIRKLFPEAKVIFATSTKVQTEKMNIRAIRYNEEIEEYNDIAVEIAKKHGFAIDDLYAVSDTLGEEAHSDPVHYYTTVGTEAFANEVLRHLSATLKLEEVPVYREALYTDEPIGI